MQDRDEHNKILHTELLDDITKQPELTKGATNRVIGTMPRAGETIIVNGLEFNVVSADYLNGRFVANIKKG